MGDPSARPTRPRRSRLVTVVLYGYVVVVGLFILVAVLFAVAWMAYGGLI